MNYDIYNFIRTAKDEQLVDIALKMIAEHPDTFEKLAGNYMSAISVTDTNNNRSWIFTAEQIKRIRSIPEELKVSRIKEVRSITGFGLKEAKDMVECQSFIDAMK